MGLALSLIDEDASAAGFAGATTAATMMAIVHRRYGRPDVLEHTEVDKPVVGDFDGDGYTDIGVYRAGTGQWHLKSVHRGVQIVGSYPYGGDPSDVPLG